MITLDVDEEQLAWLIGFLADGIAACERRDAAAPDAIAAVSLGMPILDDLREAHRAHTP